MDQHRHQRNGQDALHKAIADASSPRVMPLNLKADMTYLVMWLTEGLQSGEIPAVHLVACAQVSQRFLLTEEDRIPMWVCHVVRGIMQDLNLMERDRP